MKISELFENESPEDFAEKVLKRLSDWHRSQHTAADIPAMKGSAIQMMKAGWSFEDVVSHMKNMEEVNPDLPEETALARMKKISDKYK
jgi:hypothetical protein